MTTDEEAQRLGTSGAKGSEADCNYLSRLSPNLIALILQKLDVSVSSEVLGHMEGEKLGPMIGHMVEPRKTDPGVDQVLAAWSRWNF
jgi:flagellar motor switch protein FliG